MSDVLVGDDAFPLTTTLMKPFPQSNLTMEKRVFNYRSSRSRRIPENTFGILANRWRVFRRPFALEPEKVKIITLSALILHNWLRSESSSGKIYIPQSLIDSEDTSHEILPGNWRSDVPTESWFDLTPTRSKHSSNQANAIREEFMEYFMNEGCLPWQWQYARVDI